MKNLKIVLVSLWAGLMFLGCWWEETPADDFKDALPEQEDLEIRMGLHDPGEGEVQQALLDPYADCEECCVEGEGEDARYIDGDLYTLTRAAKWHVNGGLIVTMGWIRAIVDFPASEESDDELIWGPWRENLGRVEFRFVMAKRESMLYVFRLEGKNINDPGDTWTAVVQGEVEATGTPHRGQGKILLDYDAVHALDSAHPSFEKGKIEYVFDVREIPYTVDAVFHHVEVDDEEVVDGIYKYERYEELAGYFRFTTNFDIEGLDGLNETLDIETQWTAEGQGLGVAAITGGSLPAANVDAFTMTECWADATGLFYQTYLNHEVSFGDGTSALEEDLCGAEAHCPVF